MPNHTPLELEVIQRAKEALAARRLAGTKKRPAIAPTPSRATALNFDAAQQGPQAARWVGRYMVWQLPVFSMTKLTVVPMGGH